MNPKFDYEYVCYVFSGLRDWTLLDGNPFDITPEKPVKYAIHAESDFPQVATFAVDPTGNFFMDINGNAKIVECSLEYMESEFGGSKAGVLEITPPLPAGAAVNDGTSPYIRISPTKWVRG
jgi:hypothetical protein